MRHGGDLDEAVRLYGAPPQGWLDLSTGINPRPFPTERAGDLANRLARLPTPRELESLLVAARAAYGVPDGLAITAGPGTEVLIRALPQVIAGRVAILDTSYRSYRESFRDRGTLAGADAETASADPSLSVIVVNPNNPDGRVLSSIELLTMAQSRAPGALLVVDESYAEAEPGASVVPKLRRDSPVLVLKSFGKFFGLPGLRLGFAIGPEHAVNRLAGQIGDWPVSGPAIAIGTAALRDTRWQAETRHWMGNQAQGLDSVLRGSGMQLGGGCRLFRVGLAEDAPALHGGLARQGIWTRIFEERPGLLRFGLPPDMAGLQRLAEALAAS
jgi:cobalamin biosynthetic protein CobC